MRRFIYYNFLTISFIWTNFITVNTISMSYSRSIVQLEKLAYSDVSIVEQMLQGNKTLPANSLRQHILMYVQDFEGGMPTGQTWKDWTLKKKASFIAGNPISAFRLIRRYSYYLPYLLGQVRAHFDISKESVIDMKKGTWPDQQDIDDSIEGILRLHHVYNLDCNHFASGDIVGVQTGATLDAVHCYDIGVYGSKNEYFDLAIEWLELARDKSVLDRTIEKDYVDRALEEAVKIHNEELVKKEFWIPSFFVNPVSLKNRERTKRTKRSQNLLAYFKGLRKLNYLDINYWALCQGENLQTEEEKAELFCWLETKLNGGLRIAPIKMEFLARNPDVVQMYNVISDDQIDKLIQKSTPHLEQAVVVDINGGDYSGTTVMSKTRTSMTNWLDDDDLKGCTSITENIQQFTGLTTKKNTSAEDLQIASYAFSGFYEPHLDALLYESAYGDMGDRIATFMIYLSDIELGGKTAFPMLGFAANPVKGSAVFWYSLHRDGSADKSTHHAACPVLIGSKWVANKWIRMNDQMFTHKCSIEQKQRFQIPVNLHVIYQEIGLESLEEETEGEVEDVAESHSNSFSYGSAPALKHRAEKDENIYNYIRASSPGNCDDPMIQSFLNDYEATTTKLVQNFSQNAANARSKYELVSWNPLASFRMLRRYATYLKPFMQITMYNYEDSDCFDIYQFLQEEKTDVYWPSEVALNDSMTGLLTLQHVYDLKAEDIASGMVAGRDNGITLEAIHCYEIGSYAIENEYFTQGIDWLEVVLNKTKKVTSESSGILNVEQATKALENAMQIHDEKYDTSEGWEPMLFEHRLAERNGSDRVSRKVVQYNAFKMMEEPNFSEIQYLGICSGKQHQTEAEKAKLFCWYEREIHPYWKINPIKAEVHSMEPKLEIIQYHDVLQDKLIENMIRIATPQLSKSATTYQLTNASRHLNSRLRLSSNSWLSELIDEAYKTSKIIELITGMKVIGTSTDDLQMTSYTTGSHYVVHTDTSSVNEDKDQSRIATFMLYLSDVAEGGTTAFSQAGIKVQPEKGSAVFWYNLYPSGELNDRTWHGSCPIIFGEKWVANKWLHYDMQTLVKKCPLDKFQMNEVLVNGKSKYDINE